MGVFPSHLQMEYVKKLLNHSVCLLIETYLSVQTSRICFHCRQGLVDLSSFRRPETWLV